MSQYTSSPWKVFDAWQTQDHLFNFSRIGNDEKDIIKPVTFNDELQANESDIHLICASPEMLEALKFIVEQMSNPVNANQTLGAYIYGIGFDMAIKAIKKAEGK